MKHSLPLNHRISKVSVSSASPWGTCGASTSDQSICGVSANHNRNNKFIGVVRLALPGPIAVRARHSRPFKPRRVCVKLSFTMSSSTASMLYDLEPRIRTMLSHLPTVLFAALTLALLVLLLDYAKMLRLRARMPPGPFPFPIIGNVLQFPKSKPWVRFEEWSQRYNDPMITVWIGRTPTVVLNDAWTASELMDKRASIYSSRPTFQVPGRVMGGETWAQTMLPYGDRWRFHRKMMVLSFCRNSI